MKIFIHGTGRLRMRGRFYFLFSNGEKQTHPFTPHRETGQRVQQKLGKRFLYPSTQVWRFPSNRARKTPVMITFAQVADKDYSFTCVPHSESPSLAFHIIVQAFSLGRSSVAWIVRPWVRERVHLCGQELLFDMDWLQTRRVHFPSARFVEIGRMLPQPEVIELLVGFLLSRKTCKFMYNENFQRYVIKTLLLFSFGRQFSFPRELV